MCSGEGRMDRCRGKRAYFFSYSNSGSVARRLTVFKLMHAHWGERGPQWWDWHDGSWVADHILWLSWRCAWLVWLLTQIECSQYRWTLSQTQGHWWLTYAWWLERLHQNYWYILLRRFLGMQSSVWINSSGIFFAFDKNIWDILTAFRQKS